MRNRIKKHHIALLGLLSVLAVGSIFYLQNDQNENNAFIRAYEQNKDFQPLVKLMNENMFWVSENPDFSPEKMLLSRAPSNAPEKKGSVNIDVIEADNTTAGFIAYYRKSPERGYIWLLAVDKTFRGRGFGEMLAGHALSVLKRQGAKYADLGTRIINKPALTLYKKLGFVEQYRDEDRGMVTLKKNL